jgi:hypothetical protein
MKKLLLLVSILCISVNAYAQQGKPEKDIKMDPAVVETDRPGVVHGGGRDSGGSGGNQQGRPIDPYPALTQANNAYNQAVAVYQRAYQNYQTALAKRARLRDHYVDSNNNVRPGFDYHTAVAVLHAADNEVTDAYLELSKAESDKNAAHSNAASEFVKASEQYAHAQREATARQEAARQAAAKRENSYGSRHDHN